MEQYLEERAVLEMKYSDLCKPLYEEKENVVAGNLDNGIERIHKEGGGNKNGGGEKEEEGLKGDDDDSNNDAGEGVGRIPGGRL